MIDQVRLESALRRARGGLFRHWDNRGFWKSGLSASALSTATAVSAFSLVYKHLLNGGMDSESACRRSTHSLSDEELAAMKSLVVRADDWLVDRQNEDGGWGDTDRSRSNIATTVLVKSALLLANYVYDNGNVDISLNGPGGADPQRRGSPGSHRRSSPYHDSIVAGWSMDTLAKTDLYIRRHGGIDGIKKRYGEDQTFSAPILTNAALAGFVPWSEVPVLPFDLASFPQAFFRFLRMPVVSYAIPALVAIGQCKFHHCPTSNIFVLSSPLEKTANFIWVIRSVSVHLVSV